MIVMNKTKLKKQWKKPEVKAVLISLESTAYSATA